MPLRFIKIPKIDTQNALHLAVTATALTKELTNMACFPPAIAAVSVVLLIFEALEDVQSNKEACLRLARRCARILLDLNAQMEGRWGDAPPNLLKNLERFQETLTSIHEFMKIQSREKWGRRFIQKSSVENALIDYTAQLNDAAQSFQIATLIDIHYAVSRSMDQEKDTSNPLPSPPPPYTTTNPSHILASPVEIVGVNKLLENNLELDMKVNEAEPELVTDGVLEDHGFRRYHQSEVRLDGNVRLKGGWWEGASGVEVDGRSSLIKRYESPHKEAMKCWMRDVRLLQNVYHPNLPQMIGFSAEGAPTPFILLSNVHTRSPQALLLSTIKTSGLAACVDLILRFYQDITDATSYVQRQIGLDEHKAQDFVGDASYRVDGSNTIIMGLPPIREGWNTFRSYNLTESLTMAVTNMLPKGGIVQYKRIDKLEEDETARKVTHLVALAQGLLPGKSDPPSLSARVRALMIGDDGDDDELAGHHKLNLRQLRMSNIEANRHDHVWSKNSGIPSHKFTVGDFGYIPKGEDFDSFILLGNVIKDGLAEFPIENYASGNQWCWKDIPPRHVEIDPYTYPNNVTCWPMAVPHGAQIDCAIVHSAAVAHVADAWRFFLEKCQFIANKFSVRPEELILITRAGTEQNFYIKDFRTPGHIHVGFQRPVHKPFIQHHQAGQNQFKHFPSFPQQNSIPTIMYLFTSLDPGHTPYWAHSPVCVPKEIPPPELHHGWIPHIGWCTGFINWIQLHPEDFTD